MITIPVHTITKPIKKAYDKLEKLVSFVNDPKGTYDHYTETYSADKSAVANAYKDIEPE